MSTSTWKYNKEKHQLDEQPTMKEPDNSTGWSEDSNGLRYKDLYHQKLDKEVQEIYDRHLAFLRHIPVSGSVYWKEGQEVVENVDFGINYFSAKEKSPVAIPIKQEQPHPLQAVIDGIDKIDAILFPKNQSQEQPVTESEDERIETATIWCEVIHAINEADKKGVEVGEFIPTVLEKQFTIKRK